MVDRPVIARARLCRELAARHPRGLTAGQAHQMVLMAWAMPAAEVRRVLDDLVADGLAARTLEPRPRPREPLTVYVAADRLLPGGPRP